LKDVVAYMQVHMHYVVLSRSNWKKN